MLMLVDTPTDEADEAKAAATAKKGKGRKEKAGAR